MTEKHTRAYNYLGELKISVTASEEFLNRIDRHMATSPIVDAADVSIVVTEVHPPVTIIKDKKYNYSSIVQKENSVLFFRYNTHTATIVNNGSSLDVTTYMKNDEDMVLRCMREHYFNTANSKDKLIMHGALVNYLGKGILLTGDRRNGKSSLVLSLMEELGANFVSECDVLIENKANTLYGSSFPKPVYIRVYPFVNSRLGCLLNSIDETESIQPVDPDAFLRIKEKKFWNADEFISISRKKLAQVFGVKDLESSTIDLIIMPSYIEEKKVSLNDTEFKNVRENLLQQVRPKDGIVDGIRTPDYNLFSNIEHLLETKPIRGISFNNKNQLNRRILEELVA